MIPDWFTGEHVEVLRWVLIGVIVVLIAIVVLVLRLTRKFATFTFVLVLLGSLAVVLWLQRAQLQDCVSGCSCRFFNQTLEVPASVNPDCE